MMKSLTDWLVQHRVPPEPLYVVFGIVLLGALVLGLTACGANYSKFRPDAEDWDRASGECMSRAAAAAPPGTPMRALAMRDVYNPCMQARGWKED
jgi:hypothetical protein